MNSSSWVQHPGASVNEGVDVANRAAEISVVIAAIAMEMVGSSTLLVAEYVVGFACMLIVTVTVAVTISGFILATEDTDTLELVDLFVTMLCWAEDAIVVK